MYRSTPRNDLSLKEIPESLFHAITETLSQFEIPCSTIVIECRNAERGLGYVECN